MTLQKKQTNYVCGKIGIKMRVSNVLLLTVGLLQVACSSVGNSTKSVAAPKQNEAPNSENAPITYALAQQASMESLADLWICLSKSAKNLDDKTSDASTIALAISETCRPQFDAYNKMFCFASKLKHKDSTTGPCLSVMNTPNKRRELSLLVVLEGRSKKQRLTPQGTKL